MLYGGRYVWKSALNQTISAITISNKIDDCKSNEITYVRVLVKVFKTVLCAVSIFFIPLFECLCCEDDAISSTCCNNQNTANETCDVHPCLDAIDELGVVEILDFSNFLGTTKVNAFNLVPRQDSTGVTQRFCSPPISFKTKRHLIIGVIIV